MNSVDYSDSIGNRSSLWVASSQLLIANDPSDPHRGTLDVDLALNHLEIPEEAYATIHELLVGHGYRHNTEKAKQFQYFRDIELGETTYTVVVDLLTGQYDVDSGKKRRHEPIQDVMALKARGVDLVYSRFKEVEISGELPNRGGKYSAKCRVADVVPLTVMKAVCMEDRYKSKDAYDLYYTIRHYPGGLPAIVAALKPDLNNGLVAEQRICSPGLPLRSIVMLIKGSFNSGSPY